MEMFSDLVPNTTTFSVGFYEGRQSKKRWLYCQDDLDGMYGTRDGGEITLWCEGKKNGLAITDTCSLNEAENDCTREDGTRPSGR